jgi:hypothetical protein
LPELSHAVYALREDRSYTYEPAPFGGPFWVADAKELRQMRRETVAHALSELDRVLPTLAGDERRRFVRIEARLRAVLADRCSTPDGCRGCLGQCALELAPALMVREGEVEAD